MPEGYERMVSALKEIGIPFAENDWNPRPNCDHYGIVALEFEGDSDEGDNLKQDRSWEGSVDLFSKEKRGGGWPAEIEEILTESCECAWEMTLCGDWEPESLLFHWEWAFRMEAGE